MSNFIHFDRFSVPVSAITSIRKYSDKWRITWQEGTDCVTETTTYEPAECIRYPDTGQHEIIGVALDGEDVITFRSPVLYWESYRYIATESNVIDPRPVGLSYTGTDYFVLNKETGCCFIPDDTEFSCYEGALSYLTGQLKRDRDNAKPRAA